MSVVTSVRFCGIRGGAMRNRSLMFADTNECGYVWTGQGPRKIGN